MDHVVARYERIVSDWSARTADPMDLVRLAADAARLAADASPGWYGSQSGALRAAALAAAGHPPDIAVIIDADLPPVDPTAPARLADLLPGDGPLHERIHRHRATMLIPPDRLAEVAARLLRLFQRRATEDLELGQGVPLEIGLARPRNAGPAEVDLPASSPRLKLDTGRAWTAEALARCITGRGVPGDYLVATLRPARPSWHPSPQDTVDHGLRAVGREVLLSDHELGHELQRIGRGIGVPWDAELILGVWRATDDLAPARAAALAAPSPATSAELESLGMAPTVAASVVERASDPLERARWVARAAGPPLVRRWLTVTGQTVGLGRLVREHLVPSQLRVEVGNAGA